MKNVILRIVEDFKVLSEDFQVLADDFEAIAKLTQHEDAEKERLFKGENTDGIISTYGENGKDIKENAESTKKIKESTKENYESIKETGKIAEEYDQSIKERVNQEIKIEAVRAVLSQKTRNGKVKEVKELIKKYGADKLTALNPSCYKELLREAENI